MITPSEPAQSSQTSEPTLLATETPAQNLITPTMPPSATALPRPIWTPVDLKHPYDEKANARQEVQAALEIAKAENKLILLDFGANWCPDCLVLSRLFEDESVKPILEQSFVIVRIDVGFWTKNLELSKEYNNPIEKGIPAVVILNTEGKVIASTKEGELANARTATADDIKSFLNAWLTTGLPAQP